MDAAIPTVAERVAWLADMAEAARGWQEHVDAAVARKRKNATKGKGNQRYKATKHSKYFMAKGTPRALSNAGSRLLHWMEQPELTPNLVPTQEVTAAEFFHNEQVQNLGNFAPVREAIEALGLDVQTQRLELERKLGTSEFRSSRGLCHSVGTAETLAKVKEIFNECAILTVKPFDVAGLQIFVDTTRNWAVRQMFTAVPYWGHALFLTSIDRPLAVMVLNIADLMEKGNMTCLERLPQAMETRWATLEKFQTTVVPPDTTLYIPFGHVPLIVGSEELNSFVVIPYVSATLQKEGSTEVAELVMNACNKHFRTVTRSPWTTINATWKKYKEAVEE